MAGKLLELFSRIRSSFAECSKWIEPHAGASGTMKEPLRVALHLRTFTFAIRGCGLLLGTGPSLSWLRAIAQAAAARPP